MYEEIESYRQITLSYHRNYNLLFSIAFLYSNKRYEGKKTAKAEAIFDDNFLGMLLREFYLDVVAKEHNMNVISEEDLLERYQLEDGSYELYDDEIMIILPKHTRHLAMINLIMRGCNPVMIKEFAGHTNGAISFNYYGNITKTVRCVTKILYDINKNGSSRKKVTNVTEPNPLSLMIKETDSYVEVDAGKCYSNKFCNSNIEDCYRCGGDCRTCRYLIPDNKDNVIVDEDKMDKEMVYIAKMLSNEKIANKLTEYQLRMQSLQKDIANLASKVWQEEEINGKETKI